MSFFTAFFSLMLKFSDPRVVSSWALEATNSFISALSAFLCIQLRCSTNKRFGLETSSQTASNSLVSKSCWRMPEIGSRKQKTECPITSLKSPFNWLTFRICVMKIRGLTVWIFHQGLSRLPGEGMTAWMVMWEVHDLTVKGLAVIHFDGCSWMSLHWQFWWLAKGWLFFFTVE